MRTVVVGGSSGLGLEIARNRAKLGDAVVVTSRSADRAAEVSAELGAKELTVERAPKLLDHAGATEARSAR